MFSKYLYLYKWYSLWSFFVVVDKTACIVGQRFIQASTENILYIFNMHFQKATHGLTELIYMKLGKNAQTKLQSCLRLVNFWVQILCLFYYVLF